MSDYIPTDTWAMALSRLPVKTLLQVRSVSKTFRDLIDSPHFVKLHLQYSIKTKSNFQILVVSSNRGVYGIDFDTFETAIRLSCPKVWVDGTEYVGSCNGIVMLYNGRDEFTLWNIATRRYIDVSIPAIHVSDHNYSFIFGFGFDCVNEDYKVVKLLQNYHFSGRNKNDEFLKEVEVYSLKSNSWTRVQDFPVDVRSIPRHATFVSGVLHWISYGEMSSIVAFDLQTEEFRILPAPEYKYPVQMVIGSLEGHLWVNCFLNRSDRRFCDPMPIADTWIMEEYGVQESWTKLVPATGPLNDQQPVIYSKCGTYILLDKYGAFFSYNLLMQEYHNIFVSGLPIYYNSDVCVQSLVHLNGGASDETRVTEKIVTEQIEVDTDDDSDGTPGQSYICCCIA